MRRPLVTLAKGHLFPTAALRAGPVRLPAAPGGARSFALGAFGAQPRAHAARGFAAQAATSRSRIAPWTLLGSGTAVSAALAWAYADPSVWDKVGEKLEDWNDASREFFENIGDKIVGAKKEPWLLDLKTMKFPEHLPTLIMDLDKVLVRLEYDRHTGWQVVKRPGADQFLKDAQYYYELVIFSDEVFPVALDVVHKWGIPVNSVLHREFCKRKRATFVKDISKLGRNLDKMVIIDHDSAAFSLQPENGILIRPFEGDPTDHELPDLLEFLKAMAASHKDVREFIGEYGGGDEDIAQRYKKQMELRDKTVAARRGFGRAFGSGMSSRPGEDVFGRGGVSGRLGF